MISSRLCSSKCMITCTRRAVAISRNRDVHTLRWWQGWVLSGRIFLAPGFLRCLSDTTQNRTPEHQVREDACHACLMRLYCPTQDKEIIYYLLVHGGNIVIIDPTYTTNIKVNLKCVLRWDLIRACKIAKYPMVVKYLNHTGDKLHCWISLPLCNFWEKNFMQACKFLLYEHQFCTFTI